MPPSFRPPPLLPHPRLGRCPAPTLSAFLDCGITTVVGLLGTDNVSRTQEELVIKARRVPNQQRRARARAFPSCALSRLLRA